MRRPVDVMSIVDPASDPPLVSCVIIFLNGEAFIAEAIESVLAQTWPNWELILVDDGTTDGAADIARRYCEAHPDRIRLIAHEGGRNLGMSASRNAGVRASRGKFVAYLDADDIWLPERLAVHVEALESHPHVAMTAASTFFWRSWNPDAAPWWRPWASVDISHGTGLGDRQITHAPDTATHFLGRRGGGMPGVCSVLVRRSVLEAVGGGEDGFRTLYEDQVLMFKVFLEHPVMGIGRILDLYRQHPELRLRKRGADGVRQGSAASVPRLAAFARRRAGDLGSGPARGARGGDPPRGGAAAARQCVPPLSRRLAGRKPPRGHQGSHAAALQSMAPSLRPDSAGERLGRSWRPPGIFGQLRLPRPASDFPGSRRRGAGLGRIFSERVITRITAAHAPAIGSQRTRRAP